MQAKKLLHPNRFPTHPGNFTLLLPSKIGLSSTCLQKPNTQYRKWENPPSGKYQYSIKYSYFLQKKSKFFSPEFSSVKKEVLYANGIILQLGSSENSVLLSNISNQV